MNTEYDADDFDMEPVSGTDNPAEPGDTYDEAVSMRPAFPSNRPKAYTMRTRVKAVDKKTGQIIYRVTEQPSNQHRKLVKPFSYKHKK